MSKYVCNGAKMKCSFGTGTASLIVLPTKKILEEKQPAANIMDYAPMVNIPSFGNCLTVTNPVVAAATAKNAGVLEPKPCVPVTTAPWTPGKSDVLMAKMPALTDDCTNLCTWTGVITITNAGQGTIKT